MLRNLCYVFFLKKNPLSPFHSLLASRLPRRLPRTTPPPAKTSPRLARSPPPLPVTENWTPGFRQRRRRPTGRETKEREGGERGRKRKGGGFLQHFNGEDNAWGTTYMWKTTFRSSLQMFALVVWVQLTPHLYTLVDLILLLQSEKLLQLVYMHSLTYCLAMCENEKLQTVLQIYLATLSECLCTVILDKNLPTKRNEIEL